MSLCSSCLVGAGSLALYSLNRHLLAGEPMLIVHVFRVIECLIVFLESSFQCYPAGVKYE